MRSYVGSRSSLWTCGCALPLVFLLSVIAIRAEEAKGKAGASFPDIPASIDSSAKYLFYLHGAIVETMGRNAVSKQHGRYHYDDIVKTFVDRGFIVISEIRPSGTGLDYAQKVTGQIRKLIAAKVPAQNITVIGHSKGGAITVATSAALSEPNMNFVIMAGCGLGGMYQHLLREFAPRMKGRILSLYDESDTEAGTCQEAFELAPGLEHKEITLKTGLGHGLFYAPRKEWIDVVVEFTTSTTSTSAKQYVRTTLGYLRKCGKCSAPTVGAVHSPSEAGLPSFAD